MGIKKIKNFIADWLFPCECVVCQRPGKWLCDICFKDIEFTPANFCSFCRSFSFLGLTCRKCRKENFLDGVFSYGFYKDIRIKKIIYHYKYNYLTDFKEILAKFLCQVIKNIELAQKSGYLPRIIFEDTLYFFVPLHSVKLRIRGFNQSELLMNELVKQKIIKKENIFYSGFLKRKRYTFSQSNLNKEERRKNIQNAFLYFGDNLKNKNVILIDDVATTASTLEEIAKILKENGAGKVFGIVVARG